MTESHPDAASQDAALASDTHATPQSTTELGVTDADFASSETSQREPGATGLEIAVVGMAGRFPGAQDLDQLWSNLRGGVESIRFFTDDELLAAGVPAETLERPDYVKARGVIEGREHFDAALFGFNPREAELLDPQHRLFLETAWRALEDAGQFPEQVDGPIGIYAGSSQSWYYWRHIHGNHELLAQLPPFQAAIGNERDFLATRVSYKLGLDGPSLTVQTACSTSLVAVHLACQGLLSGECDLALAGGVSLSVPAVAGYFYHEGGIVSPDGHCRAFDARAAGTVAGEGVGLVTLKRLEDALADGDRIRAVIKGSAVNNDGGFRVGYTAPSVEGQARVIRAALEAADVDPHTVSYVEAHGAATPLGDPTEVSALIEAFGNGHSGNGHSGNDHSGEGHESLAQQPFCGLGSIKTNIGHLDAAAGIAGFIKTVLALENGELPPSLNFDQPNPQIDFDDGPFFVNRELRPWAANGRPRRAGVSSFGLGGTNAHVVLEEAPTPAGADGSRPCHLLVLSARSEPVLDTFGERLADDLEARIEALTGEGIGAADVAATLQLGRAALPVRRALVVDDTDAAGLAAALRDPEKG